MIEKEIRGFINKENFANLINNFTNSLGEAKYSKRLSLALADYDNLTLETKVRIINGKAEIINEYLIVK